MENGGIVGVEPWAVVIVVAAAVLVLTSLFLRTRLPAALVLLLVSGSAVAVAAGGLLAQQGVTFADWAVALPVAAAAAAGHVRLLLGRFGPPPADVSGTVSPANDV
ncbi:MAG: hypothetical protein WD004_03475 [Actinomycetota bacterium]